MMDLNDVQEGVVNIAFKVADEQGLLLLGYEGSAGDPWFYRRTRRRIDHAIWQRFENRPWAPSSASFWCWENQGADKFFGEPRAGR